MNILIDGRIWSLFSAGVGTFFTCAIMEWAKQRKNDILYIILPKGLDTRYELSSIPDNIKLLDYSKQFPERLPNIIILQLLVPYLCRKLHINMYYSPVPHLPYFIPSKVKTMVTIHDVVNIEMAQTMSWTNRLATSIFFGQAIKKANFLWTNSYYTKSKVEAYYHDLIPELVDKINEDASHITLKIRQTRKLIDATLQPDYKQQLEGRFTYTEYIQMLGYPERVERVEERTELLPPPIFRPRALLVKSEVVNELLEAITDEGERMRLLYEKVIDLNQLSSGERQFIYTMSTLVYHAFNLKSVPEIERVAYKNICHFPVSCETIFHQLFIVPS